MIFPHTRTRRLSVRLVELSLGEGMELAKLPAERHELTATEMLRFAAKNAEQPQPGFVANPLLWTVEERMLLVTSYLAHVADDGPDFSVGNARLSDYVMFDRDLPADSVDLGLVAGVERGLRPLLGAHVQALETTCKSRGDWIIGAIACQMFPKGTPEPDWVSMSDVAMLEWLDNSIARIKALPESMFEEVFAAYWTGADALAHFFRVDFDDQGIVCLPSDKEAGHGPARFLASACISRVSKALAG